MFRLSQITRHCVVALLDANRAFEEAHVVVFGARIADSALYFAGGDIERRDEALGAVALVFVFPPLRLARLHRQARRGTLQCLHAAHLVD